jgi:membrane fusion protein, heavy metal efflux system
VATDAVHIVASVPELEGSRVRQVTGGELLIAGEAEPAQLGKPLSTGRVIDPSSRTLTVTFALRNNLAMVAVGQAVRIRLFISGSTAAPAVPETAIVDDGGQPIVFVQAGGESFARRTVRTGAHEAGYVQVEGLQAGDRVVARGAYLIRLAAMSSQVPAHGHVH